jgi:hypothetical protein
MYATAATTVVWDDAYFGRKRRGASPAANMDQRLRLHSALELVDLLLLVIQTPSLSPSEIRSMFQIGYDNV